MTTEDYVSFETAKLLKEKRFDEHCFCINYPLPEGGHHNIILPNLLNNFMIPFTNEYKFCRYKEDFITIPTLQMAMKWLREVHNLVIQVELIDFLEHGEVWLYSIIERKTIEQLTGRNEDFTEHSYEEACEAAIKYCLKNLI